VGIEAAQFTQQVVSGIAIGSVYALVALGFVLIYKATEVVNFAQGELLMLGAFLAYTLIVLLGLNFWLGGLLAVVLTAAFGFLLERTVVRPIVGQPVFAIVMVTIGIGFVARSVVTMIPPWGVDTHVIQTPFSNRTLSVAGVVLSQDHVAVVVLTVILCLGLFGFFRYTTLGVAMQATSQNQLAAYYVGIPVKRVFSLIWAISAGVAAFAGVLLAPVAFVHANMGFIGIKAFPAAVLGGFGSILGSLVAGILIGLIESLGGLLISPSYKTLIVFALYLAVVLVRPRGLFGRF